MGCLRFLSSYSATVTVTGCGSCGLQHNASLARFPLQGLNILHPFVARTPILNIIYRLLGMKIGKGVVISALIADGHDLISVSHKRLRKAAEQHFWLPSGFPMHIHLFPL